MNATTSRLTVDLPAKDHKRLKMTASLLDISMSIEEFMHRKPNKITEKALKDSQSGKNLKKFNNLDEMFDDLGI